MTKRMTPKSMLAILLGILSVAMVQVNAIAENQKNTGSAQSLFADTLAVWQLGDMNDSSGRNNTLKLNGEAKIGVGLKGREYEASLKRRGDGKAAVFDRQGSLVIEAQRVKNLRPSGDALTFCIRARLSGPGALFFSDYFSLVTFDKGLVIAFLGSETPEGKVYREIPLGFIKFNQWHDLIIRYDGDKLECFADGELLNAVLIKERLCSPFESAANIGCFRAYRATRTIRQMIGIVDHLFLWDRAITDKEVALLSGRDSLKPQAALSDADRCVRAYNDFFDASVARDIEACKRLDLEMRNFMDRDAARPKYHITAPMGWMFDPAGAYYYRGNYHVYTYRNVYARLEYNSLDHYVSKDLINWRQWPIGVWADSAWDVYSIRLANHFIDDNGVPTMIYTSLGSGARGRYGVLARSYDNLLSYGSKQGGGKQDAFGFAIGDSQTWKDGDIWYTITAKHAENPSDLGDALTMFSSPDLKNWTEIGPIFYFRKQLDSLKARPVDEPPSIGMRNTAIRAEQGRAEFPYLIPFGDKHVLMAGARPVRYWVGTFDKEQYVFAPDDPKGKLLNYLDYFYCFNPMIVDSKGPDGSARRVMMALESRVRGSVEGLPWYGVLVLPRSIRLEAGRLIQEPVAETKQLRGRHFSQSNIAVTPNAKGLIKKDKGDTLEIIAEFEPGDAEVFGLKVRMSDDGKDFARIFYDTSTGNYGVDGNISESPFKEQGQGPSYIAKGQPVTMRIFLDGSLLEVFVNGTTCTGKLELDSSSVGLDLFSIGGSAKCKRLDIWEMKPAWSGQLSTDFVR